MQRRSGSRKPSRPERQRWGVTVVDMNVYSHSCFGPVQLAELILTFGLMASLIGWMVLLNLRDRRQSALNATVTEQFSSEEFRGRVAIRIRCLLLSRKSEVTVDLLACSRDELWGVIARLARIPVLSPSVSVHVTDTGDQCLATFTVATTSRAPLAPVCQPSVATG